MKRALTSASLVLFTTLGLACGGGETEEAAPPAAEPAAPAAPAPAAATMPAWFRVNGTNVEIDVMATATPKWNFNGGFDGDMTINVPVGSMVTINFKNSDAMVHSLGIVPAGAPAPMYTGVTPAFAGAVTADAADMAKATLAGEKESIHFTADKEGQYTMVCFIAGHGLAGMWIHFNVGGGAPGVTGDKGVAVSVN